MEEKVRVLKENSMLTSIKVPTTLSKGNISFSIITAVVVLETSSLQNTFRKTMKLLSNL